MPGIYPTHLVSCFFLDNRANFGLWFSPMKTGFDNGIIIGVKTAILSDPSRITWRHTYIEGRNEILNCLVFRLSTSLLTVIRFELSSTHKVAPVESASMSQSAKAANSKSEHSFRLEKAPNPTLELESQHHINRFLKFPKSQYPHTSSLTCLLNRNTSSQTYWPLGLPNAFCIPSWPTSRTRLMIGWSPWLYLSLPSWKSSMLAILVGDIHFMPFCSRQC